MSSPVVHLNLDLSAWTAVLRSQRQFGEAIAMLKGELAKAVPPVMAQKFGEWMDNQALSNSSELWHIYNYGHLGDPSNRLFRILPEVKALGSGVGTTLAAEAKLDVEWIEASVPIGRPDPFHDYPGDQRTAQHVFRWQAPALEYDDVHPMAYMRDDMVFWGTNKDGDETWIVVDAVETYKNNDTPVGQFSERYQEFFQVIYNTVAVPEMKAELERQFIQDFKTASVRKLAVEGTRITTESGVTGRLAVEQFGGRETIVLITTSGTGTKKFGRANIRQIVEQVGGSKRAKELARAVAAKLQEML